MNEEQKEFMHKFETAVSGISINTNFRFKDLWGNFRKVEQRTLHRYKRELSAIGNQLNTLSLMFKEILQNHQEGKEQFVILLHIEKTITSFEAAVFLLLRSLFSEYMNSVRIGMETTWQMLYLLDLPDKRDEWYKNKSEFNTGDVRRHLNFTQQRKKIYSIYSNASHPNYKDMGMFMVHIPNHVDFRPRYDEHFIAHSIFHIFLILSWITDDIMSRVFPLVKFKSIEEINEMPDFAKSYLHDKKSLIDIFRPLQEKFKDLEPLDF